MADIGGVEAVVQVLQTETGDPQETAAGALANMTFAHDDNKLRAVTAGAVEPLLRMMEDGSSSQKEVAAAALQRLATISKESKAAMMRALPIMLAVVTDRDSTDYTIERMLGAIQSMLDDDTVVEAAVEAGAIDAMVELLHTAAPPGKEKAAQCLASIAEASDVYEASVGGSGAILPLVRMLQGRHTGAQEAACAALSAMSRTCSNNKATIGNTKAIPTLVQLLGGGDGEVPADGEFSPLKVAASSALANLALQHAVNAMRIAREGAMQPLVALLQACPAGSLEDVAQALASITEASEGPTARRLSKELLELGVAVPLLRLLQGGSAGGQAAAGSVMQNLSAGSEANVTALLQAGVVPPLVQHLRSPEPVVREAAAGVLANLTVKNEAGLAALYACEGVAAAMIEALTEGTPTGRANAASVLLNVAYQSTPRAIELKNAGAVRALGVLLRDGDVYGKAAAAGALHNFAYDKDENLPVVAEAIGLSMSCTYQQAVILRWCLMCNQGFVTRCICLPACCSCSWHIQDVHNTSIMCIVQDPHHIPCMPLHTPVLKDHGTCVCETISMEPQIHAWVCR